MTRDTFAQKMCGGVKPKRSKILLDGLPSKGGNSSKGIFHLWRKDGNGNDNRDPREAHAN